MKNRPDVKALIGRRIKEARKKKKMTQTELADIIGKTESSIRKYEKGLTDIPKAVIQDIAAALEVPVADLLIVELWDAEIDSNRLAQEAAALELVSEQYGRKSPELLELFSGLNEKGQKEALHLLDLLIQVPNYQKSE